MSRENPMSPELDETDEYDCPEPKRPGIVQRGLNVIVGHLIASLWIGSMAATARYMAVRSAKAARAA